MSFSIEEYEQIQPTASVDVFGSIIKFHVWNNYLLQKANMLATKEPETVEWLRGLKKGDVLFDIGANVGGYTLMGALLSDAKVFAFEPEAGNFLTLNRNIVINDVVDRVRAYPYAISSKTEFTDLYLSSSWPIGQGGHSAGESVDRLLQPRPYPFVQGSMAVAIDDMVEQGAVPTPSHIRIDVGGTEHLVVQGLSKTLRNPELTSVLVEIVNDSEESFGVVEVMEKAGFGFDPDQAKASFAHHKLEGAGDITNYIFTRN